MAPAVLAGYRALRYELDRRIGEDGLAGIDELLNEAVSVLAGDADTLWRAITVEAKRLVSRPSLFDKGLPRDWIVTEEAQRCIKLAARAALRGEDDGPHAVGAVAHYQLFLKDTEEPEAAPDAAEVYAAALKYLLASLRRALSPGERILLNAVQGLGDKLDRIDRPDLLDAHVRDRIETLRAQRFFRSANVGTDAASLVAELIDGTLTRTSAEVRTWALAWCARILSFVEGDVARSAIAYAARILGTETLEVKIARAFVAAINDFEAGLAVLDIDDGPLATTAAFQILRRGLGAEAALARARAAGISMAMLDSDGRCSWISAGLEAGQWQTALDAVRLLEPVDFEQTPALLWVAATVLVAAQLPEDLRRSVMQDVPINPRMFPLSDDSRAVEQRSLAAAFIDRAAKRCAGLGLKREAAAAERYSLWLALRDPAKHADAMELLRKQMRDSRLELALLPLALSFELPVDKARAEQAIVRSLARSAERTPELSAASVALLLDLANNAPLEAEAFLDRHRAFLSEEIDPATLVSIEVRILQDAGRSDSAQALLETERAHVLPEAMRAVLASSFENGNHQPSVEALEILYSQDAQTATLVHLLHRYLDTPYTPRFLELARRLLSDLTNSHFALDFIRYLGEQGRDREALELIDLLGDQVETNAVLAKHAAYVRFRLGHFREAERLLALAEAGQSDADIRALRYQLLVASGQWEALDGFLDQQWRERDARSPLELVRCATLAAQTGAKRVANFVLEAVARAPDDPDVLIGAYTAVTSAGLEEAIVEASSWIVRAAELSGPDGPVQSMGLQELLDQQPEWDSRVEKAWRDWAAGSLPLQFLARIVRRPWLELQLAPLIANFDARPRKRRAVTLFSGRDRALPAGTTLGTAIAIDRTALVTLAAADLLETVFSTFDRVHVPYDLLGNLFEQRNRIAFHQPSQIAFAHQLHEMISRGHLRAFTSHALVDARLAAEVGQGLAILLSEARGQSEGQHFVVHPNPIMRLGSLLNEPASLGDYASVMVSCSSVVDALEQAGRLTQSELARARGYLVGHDARWPDEPVIARNATLYLSDLSVDYLRAAGLLGKMEAAGLNVVISPSEIRMASDLRALEALTDNIDAVIGRLRSAVTLAIDTGRAVFDASVGQGEELEGYSEGLSRLVAANAILVSDDRFLNRHSTFEHPLGMRHILSSLDLIETLLREDRLTAERAEEARTWFRRSGAMLTGIDADALTAAMALTTEKDGVLCETGDLRAIRENLRLSQASGWFEPLVDVHWLVNFQGAICATLVKQWVADIPDTLARARSNWLLSILHSPDWAQTIVEPRLEGLAVNGMALDLARVIGLARDIEEAERFCEWLEKDVFESLLAHDPRCRDQLYNHFRGLVRNVARDMVRDTKGLSQRAAQIMTLESLPHFLQLELMSDFTFREEIAQTVEAIVTIADGEFFRSAFLERVRAVYRTPKRERRIDDVGGKRWTISTEGAAHGWSLTIRRGKARYRIKPFIGLHADQETRIALFNHWLSDRGMSTSGPADWRERLTAGMLDAEQVEALEAVLADLPAAVAEQITQSLPRGEASISMLVPSRRSYFETLVGEGEASDFDTLLREVVPLQLKRIAEDYLEPDRWALLLASHRLILGDGRFGSRSGDAWRELAAWVRVEADPMSKTGFIELALAHADGDATLEGQLLELIDEIEKLDPENHSGELHLFSSLAIFVDGEISRTGILRDWSPFRRRMASLAQAALITRVTRNRIDTDHFARFCLNERGWRFVLQNLVDLRAEPRWRPEHLGATQLRSELLGRIVNAAGAQEETLTPALRTRILDSKTGLRARLPVPMAFWPGPLEGGVTDGLPSPTDEISELLDRGLAQDTMSLDTITILTNVAAMFVLPPDLATRSAVRIRAEAPTLPALFPPEHVLLHLTALAHVAATHRLPLLAEAVQIMARVHRATASDSRLHVAEEMHLALATAAAFEDPTAWRTFLGKWIGELGHCAEAQEDIERLASWVEMLCVTDPVLRTYVGRTIALLRLSLDD